MSRNSTTVSDLRSWMQYKMCRVTHEMSLIVFSSAGRLSCGTLSMQSIDKLEPGLLPVGLLYKYHHLLDHGRELLGCLWVYNNEGLK